METGRWSLRGQGVDAEPPLKGFEGFKTLFPGLAVEIQDRKITFTTTGQSDICIRIVLPPLADGRGIGRSIVATVRPGKRYFRIRHGRKDMKALFRVMQRRIKHSRRHADPHPGHALRIIAARRVATGSGNRSSAATKNRFTGLLIGGSGSINVTATTGDPLIFFIALPDAREE